MKSEALTKAIVFVIIEGKETKIAFRQDVSYVRGIKPTSVQAVRAILSSSRAEKITPLSAVPRAGGRSKICSKERRRRPLFLTLGRPSRNSTWISLDVELDDGRNIWGGNLVTSTIWSS
jgi:hypothetical protein